VKIYYGQKGSTAIVRLTREGNRVKEGHR
jgi:hypothetical protein